jgi:hypothetical protein
VLFNTPIDNWKKKLPFYIFLNHMFLTLEVHNYHPNGKLISTKIWGATKLPPVPQGLRSPQSIAASNMPAKGDQSIGSDKSGSTLPSINLLLGMLVGGDTPQLELSHSPMNHELPAKWRISASPSDVHLPMKHLALFLTTDSCVKTMEDKMVGSKSVSEDS